jgi:hypothetical protein
VCFVCDVGWSNWEELRYGSRKVETGCDEYEKRVNAEFVQKYEPIP